MKRAVALKHVLSPVLAAALLVAGCSDDDECAESAIQCSGNILRTCRFRKEGSGGHPNITTSSGYVWEDTDCKTATCVEVTTPSGKRAGVCALYKEPRPCTQLEGISSACVGAELVHCEYGYVTETKTCARADLCRPRFEDGCLARPGLDPGCVAARPTGGARSYGYCDGQVLVDCLDEGYAMEVKDCGAPDLCHSFTYSDFSAQQYKRSTCRLSTERDPRCSDVDKLAKWAGSPLAEGCNGNLSFYCLDGYMVDDQRPCRNCRVENKLRVVCDP